MEKENLKKVLIQKIIECENTDILKKIQKVLDIFGYEVKEGSEDYRIITPIKDSVLTHEQVEEVNMRYQKYLREKGKSYTWEEVEEEILKT